MPLYKVPVNVHYHGIVSVIADTKKEAEEKAQDVLVTHITATPGFDLDDDLDDCNYHITAERARKV